MWSPDSDELYVSPSISSQWLSAPYFIPVLLWLPDVVSHGQVWQVLFSPLSDCYAIKRGRFACLISLYCSWGQQASLAESNNIFLGLWLIQCFLGFFFAVTIGYSLLNFVVSYSEFHPKSVFKTIFKIKEGKSDNTSGL